jgi:multidrug efflux pump subunit AcrB
MSIARSALRHPWTVVVAVIALALGAWVAIQRMARDVFPPLGIPTIYVAQPYGGMDPAQMEGFLTYYYEYHFLYITGIEHVESKTIQGASIMKLQFHEGTDMASAMAETIAYVNRARAFMPPGTPGPFVTRFDAGSVPVGNLVFSSSNPSRSVGQMQDAALNLVRPLFATLKGVSAPPPFGGSARTIVISVKPDRLRATGLSPDDVVSAIAAANTISPSGNLALPHSYPMVPTNAVVKNIKDLAAVPLKSSQAGAVFVRDIADVSDSSDLVTSIALVNGRRTVYMPVTKRSDASTLSVVSLVKQNLPKFKAACPDDISVTFEFDQSPWIIRAISDLVKEGILGAALTGLMVLLFLRNFRTAFIVVLNIPISIASALFALWISGESVNLMTLGGLALAIGILVDEATVTIENIHAHLHRLPPSSSPLSRASLASATLKATEETTTPRLLAMLCILAVFVPSFFMTGPAKALFVPLALAVGFSMAASFLLSSTLVPILAVWWLRLHPSHPITNSTPQTSPHIPPPSPLSKAYSALISPLIAARYLLIPLYLAAASLAIITLIPKLGTEIFPEVDTGQIQLRLRAPAGTKLEITEQITQRTLDIIASAAGPSNVNITMALVGVHAPNYPVNLIHQWNSGPDEAVIQVQLKENSGVAIAQLRESLRARLASELPGISFSFEPADIVSRVMSLGAPTPVEIAISGKDFSTTRSFAESVRQSLAAIPALRDVQFGQTLDYPSVDVRVDRERAGLFGVTMSDATRSLTAATASSRFTFPNYYADPKTGVSLSLQVQIPQSLIKDHEDLLNLPISAGNSATTVPLRSFASVSPGSLIGQYDRYNMARTISVTANIHGSDLGAVAAAIEKSLASLSPPQGTSFAIRGQIQPMKDLQSGLRTGLISAIIAILLLLVASFQSVRLALAVITTIPAVILGVYLSLWCFHSTLNVQSFMGAIMSTGVAVANAILMVTFAHRAHQLGLPRHAAALAGATSRLRPILMTSLAMIAGMIPMAFGGGQAGPLGKAVLGGLTMGTLATLFLLPAAFALLSNPNASSASLDPDDLTSSPNAQPPASP